MGLPSEEHRLRAVEVLDRAGVLHALVGGYAANVYRATERRTQDIDFLVDTFDGLAQALDDAGFDIEIGRHGTQDQWLIRASVDDVGFDFSLAEVQLQVDTLDRAQDNHGIATAEDLMLLKMIPYRAEDRNDLQSIVNSGRKVDVTYMRIWAHKLNKHFNTSSRFATFEKHYREVQQQLRGPGSGGLGVG